LKYLRKEFISNERSLKGLTDALYLLIGVRSALAYAIKQLSSVEVVGHRNSLKRSHSEVDKDGNGVTIISKKRALTTMHGNFAENQEVEIKDVHGISNYSQHKYKTFIMYGRCNAKVGFWFGF
jgi:hypothetical protein